MSSLAVVGGGVSGLSAAYYGVRAGATIELYEASPRLGGVIRTERRGEYLMEGGPDSFLDKAGMADLCRELGLESQLIRVRPEARRSFIVRNGQLMPVPEGLYLMAPAAIGPFIPSRLVSWQGKARMLLDLLLPRRPLRMADESLANFVRRRLGQEALDRLAQPLLGGIYAADPEHLSLAATMPQFLAMEQRYGSVLRGLAASRQQASGARYGLFLSLRDGLQALVDALARHIPAPHLNAPVELVAPLNGPAAGVDCGARWRVVGPGSESQVDGVCLCIPPREIARLNSEVAAPPMSYSSAATLNFGFRRGQIRHPLNGAGFVVPAVERRAIMACTFCSQKYEGRAPRDRVLLRAFAGGMLDPDACALPDGQLIEGALHDLSDLLGITGDPEEVWVTRCHGSMPQYDVGHLERVAQFEASLPPGLTVAGNAYRGVGIPDCVAGGRAAAERLLQGHPARD